MTLLPKSKRSKKYRIIKVVEAYIVLGRVCCRYIAGLGVIRLLLDLYLLSNLYYTYVCEFPLEVPYKLDKSPHIRPAFYKFLPFYAEEYL